MKPTRGAVSALARMLALGLAWYAYELVLLWSDGTASDHAAVVRSWLALLPWQLALFALLGILVALAVRVARAPREGFWWPAVGTASFTFVGARVAEGALRTRSVAAAGSDLLLLAAAIALGLAIAAWCGRRLPPSLRRSWPAAIGVGLSLLVVPFIRRAGAPIALGELALSAWPGFVTPASVALAGLGTLATLGIGAVRGRARRPALLVVGFAVGLAGMPRPTAATAGPEAATPSHRPDVIFLLVDTLRDDHVGAQGSRPSLTPNLDAIAAESIRFTRAFSPGNLTRRAMPGILASSTERVVGTPLSPNARTLAMPLREAGYATFGVSANPFVSAHYGYDRGFARFSDPSNAPTFLVGSLVQLLLGIDRGLLYRFGLARSDLLYEPAEQVFARGLDLFSRAAEPAFLYLHSMDVHGPYLPPRRFLPADYVPGDYIGYSTFLRLSQAEVLAPSFAPVLTNVRQRYAAGVRHVDEAIGSLRAGLIASGRWDEALVWITADHGEALGEHGFTGHGIGWLGPVLTQVPLLLKLPRSWGIAPVRVDAPVSLFDIVPTTLSLTGLPPLPDAFGTDLSAIIHGAEIADAPALISWNPTDAGDHYAAVRGAFQLAVLIRPDGGRQRTLYDLLADPGATLDVGSAHPEVVRELEAAVDAYREREARLAMVGAQKGVDAQMRERLRALGYIDEAE